MRNVRRQLKKLYLSQKSDKIEERKEQDYETHNCNCK